MQFLIVVTSAIVETFALFDRHGNQTIPSNEVGTVLRILGHIPSEVELNGIIRCIDAAGWYSANTVHVPCTLQCLTYA